MSKQAKRFLDNLRHHQFRRRLWPEIWNLLKGPKLYFLDQKRHQKLDRFWERKIFNTTLKRV